VLAFGHFPEYIAPQGSPPPGGGVWRAARFKSISPVDAARGPPFVNGGPAATGGPGTAFAVCSLHSRSRWRIQTQKAALADEWTVAPAQTPKKTHWARRFTELGVETVGFFVAG
jgi:hypothetical protein